MDKKVVPVNNIPKSHPMITEITLRVILWSSFIYMELCTPFHRIIQPEEMWMYRYPHTKQYVSVNALWMIAIVTPMSFLTVEYARERNKTQYKRGVLCLTLLLGLNGFITTLLKIMVGRLRPDFFARCFPDGAVSSLLDNVNEFNCTGDRRFVMEGRKSFPSGHASFAFASMVFLSMFLSKKMKVFDSHRGNTLRLLCCVAPILLATCVAISRTCDYHHHWQDVSFGALLGTTIAYFCYYQYYPSFLSPLNSEATVSINNGQ